MIRIASAAAVALTSLLGAVFEPAFTPAPVTVTVMDHGRAGRAGADSARVASFLTALGRTDPVVCQMISDQIGNFWMSGEGGLGRFTDDPDLTQGAKDSLSGSVSDPRAITLLISTLSTNDACVRRVAAKLLGRSAVTNDVLRNLLTNPSSRIREAAAFAAGENERHELRGPLEHQLGDSVPGPAAMAAWALGELQDPASEQALIEAVHSTAPRVRLAGVWALGELQDASAAREVVPMLRDPDSAMRATAAEALGEMKSARTGAALVGALTDRAASVREAAVRALDDLREHSAIPALEGMVLNDPDPDIRRAAANALGDFSASRSLEPLARALADRDPEVQREAAEAIGDLDDVSKAPPALVRASASTDLELRRRATRTLGKIGDPATVTALAERITDDDKDVRLSAVEGLGEMKVPSAIPSLTRALGDRDPEVRRAAAEALGKSRE
jgi:HEAT repeat protein